MQYARYVLIDKAAELTGEEHWKDCPFGRGLYEVSNLGRIRSWNNNRWGRRATPIILKPRVNHDGYLTINLGRGVVKLVNRLVCEAFHGTPPAAAEAAHADGVRDNNRAENLSWTTPIENSADKARHGTIVRGSKSPHAKLDEQKVAEIRALFAAGASKKGLAQKYGVARATIAKIIAGEKWSHVS